MPRSRDGYSRFLSSSDDDDNDQRIFLAARKSATRVWLPALNPEGSRLMVPVSVANDNQDLSCKPLARPPMGVKTIEAEARTMAHAYMNCQHYLDPTHYTTEFAMIVTGPCSDISDFVTRAADATRLLRLALRWFSIEPLDVRERTFSCHTSPARSAVCPKNISTLKLICQYIRPFGAIRVSKAFCIPDRSALSVHATLIPGIYPPSSVRQGERLHPLGEEGRTVYAISPYARVLVAREENLDLERVQVGHAELPRRDAAVRLADAAVVV